MLTLDKLYKIKESLEELVPDSENIDFGPAHAMVELRKINALRMIQHEILLLETYDDQT